MRAMCGVELIDRKRSKNFILMLGFNKAIYQFVIANIVHWYGHVCGLRIAIC